MKKYNFKRIGAAAAAAVMLTVSGCSLYPDGKSYSWERQNNGTQEATEEVSISEDMTIGRCNIKYIKSIKVV